MKVLISSTILPGINPDFTFDAIEHGFYQMFRDHDITALLNRKNSYKKLAKEHDLLVLSGGNDTPQRIITEIDALKHFRLLNKPILGICHGAFLLTQLMDGKLIDIEGHRRTRHKITYKYTSRTINSYHGSTIVKEPEDSEVLVRDEDGHIESWIKGNVMAVVWHPEREEDFWVPDEIKKYIGVNTNDNDR